MAASGALPADWPPTLLRMDGAAPRLKIRSDESTAVARSVVAVGGTCAGKSWLLKELSERFRLLSVSAHVADDGCATTSDARLICVLDPSTERLLLLVDTEGLSARTPPSERPDRQVRTNEERMRLLQPLVAACGVTVVVGLDATFCEQAALAHSLAREPAGLLVLVQNKCTPTFSTDEDCRGYFDPKKTTSRWAECHSDLWARVSDVYQKVVCLRIPCAMVFTPSPKFTTRKARHAVEAGVAVQRIVLDGPTIAEQQVNWLANLLRTEGLREHTSPTEWLGDLARRCPE